MSDKNSEKKEIEIKRITTPQGDVPTVDSVLEALNLIVSRISALSRNFNERMKYSGATIEVSEFIEQGLSETNKKIGDLKKRLTTNSDQIDEISNSVTKLDKVVSNLEKMTKEIISDDFRPESKSYEEIIEIKNMTQLLKENIDELQKNLGEGSIELRRLYWEHNYTEIKENLEDIVAYEAEKTRIHGYFKLLNVPRPVIEIDAKILLCGATGVGKSALIRALAKDQKIKIIELNLALLLSLNPSKQVESLNNLFHYLKYKEGFKPCVLLMDNFEMINKIQDNPMFIPFIETLILEINQIHLTKDRILIIVILDDFGQIDRRLINQFNEQIELKLPDQISRALIIRKLLNEANLEINLDLDEISSKLAEPELTKGFSTKDLGEVFSIAKLSAFSEGKSSLSEKDLEEAVQVLKNRKILSQSTNIRQQGVNKVKSNKKIQDLEAELKNVKMLLTNSTRMVKHALRLALTDNYNFINRLFNHYEATNQPFSILEIKQITGMKEEEISKLLKKMPYKLLFPEMGNQFYINFDKSILEEILAEMTLAL